MNSVIQNAIIYIVVPILCIVCLILCFKVKRTQGKYCVDDSLYIFLIVLVMIVSCIICFYIGYRTIKIEENVGVISPEQKVLEAIINQQSQTLAVASISVSIIALISTGLSIFREKQIKNDEKQIIKLKIKLEKMESVLKTMTSITAIQFLEPKDSEGYYDMLSQCIEDLKDNDYSKLALLSLNASISRSEVGKKSQEVDCYDRIIKISSSIIESSATPIEKQFALIESVNARYKRARINLYEGKACEDLKKAKEELRLLSALNPIDTFGHVLNLIGLVHFWTAKADDNNAEKGMKEAQDYFMRALEKCPEKPEYLNHLGVVKINLYQMSPSDVLFNDIIGIYKRILNNNPNYPKAYTNLAHIYINVFEKELSISVHKPLSCALSKKIDKRTISKLECLLCKADHYLTKAVNLAPEFIDNHYKRGGLYTYQYLLEKLKDNNYSNYNDEKRIINSFNNADKIIKDATKTLAYKRNFYELVGDVKTALSINDILISKKDLYAEKWRIAFDEGRLKKRKGKIDFGKL